MSQSADILNILQITVNRALPLVMRSYVTLKMATTKLKKEKKSLVY